MNPRSDIDSHIDTLRNEGTSDSVGFFTLNADTALKKLANFQLPFAGAWILKIVQAVVASKTEHPIRVRAITNSTHVVFSPGRLWNLDDIEYKLLDPQPHPHADLNHLAVAFWAVAFGEKRTFSLTDASEGAVLEWDGSAFSRRSATQDQETDLSDGTAQGARPWTLVVSHNPVGKGGLVSLFEGDMQASRTNATLSKVLSDHCFTCPVPLTLGRRRLDALQLCPDHGYNHDCFPLLLDFETTDIPEFKVPAGTFEKVTSSRAVMSREEGFVGDQVDPESLNPIKSTSVAYLVSSRSGKIRPKSNSRWRIRPMASTCAWVVDGVVIARETLPLPQSVCSTGMTISAEGLATDLTSLNLIESEEKSRRLSRAMAAVKTSITGKADPLSFEQGTIPNAIAMGKTSLLGFLGVATLGVPWLGLGVLGGSAVLYMKSRRVPQREQRRLLEEFHEHARDWDSIPSTGEPKHQS